jgi:serine protease AprX
MKLDKIDPFFQKEIKNLGSKTSDKKKGFKVILSFKDIKSRDKFVLQNEKLKNLQNFDLIPSIPLELNKEQIKEYEKEDLIERIEKDQQLFLSLLEINEILDLNRSKNSQISHTGKNVTIGIVDDGIDSNFLSISNEIKCVRNRKDLKKSRENQITHGTIMASIINNQFTENLSSAIGVAPEAELIDFDISNSRDKFYFSDVLQIFDSITKQKIKIDVLMISLTTKTPSDGKDILSNACEILVDKGIVIVCPAGNFGPKPNTIGSPAAAKNVISIGSITKELTISQYSGRGPTIDKRLKPDFCLPGSKILIPLSSELRATVTGSSVSAAIGAGLIALIKEYKPQSSPQELFELLKDSSKDLELDQYSQGYGMLNINAIFEELNLIHEKIIPYDYLIKKSIEISIGFCIILIVLFYFFNFFRIS